MKSEKWTSTGARTSPTADNRSPLHGTGIPPTLTVGVEEEYLLVDPVSRQLSTRADKVVREAAEELGDRVTTELTRYQIEIRTEPHARLADLSEELRRTRSAVARAAARLGLRIISSGTPVLGQHTPPPLTAGARYAQSLAAFRALDHEQTVCACHVHVGMPDLTTALQVSNHLRCWLPALIAISANSPYWDAHDTGYDSWRTLTWGRWPASGPPPYFESAAHFEGLVEDLITSGTLLDRGGLYWDIRPSHHVPTLEIRVADAAPTVTDALVFAAAVKGLAAAALSALQDGRPAPCPAPELLRAAYWRAARDGVRGKGIDLRTSRLEPADAQAARLWNTVLPALTPAESAYVRSARGRLSTAGNGADRQRAAYRRRHSLHDVVDHLMTEALAP